MQCSGHTDSAYDPKSVEQWTQRVSFPLAQQFAVFAKFACALLTSISGPGGGGGVDCGRHPEADLAFLCLILNMRYHC